jgi:signal transduction histidine kinase
MLQTPPSVPLPISFTIVGTVIILFFVVFFYLFIIQMQRRRSIHQKEMFDLKAQYEQTILLSQLEIQEQTFRNISQEIHDNIGQVLSLAKLNLNTLSFEASPDKIALTEELLGKAINDLRDLSKSMHPEKISDIGLVNSIRHELFLVQKAAKISTELVTDGNELKIGNEKSIIIFRMIQESLHNAIKHAKAKNITVTTNQDAHKLMIDIIDDGIGFDMGKLKNTETGIGLKSIEQRCALIGASFKINSSIGSGTSVQLIINNN